jgi:hypothetical protein
LENTVSIVIALIAFGVVSVILVRRWLPFRYAVPIMTVKFAFPGLYWYFQDSLPSYYWLMPDSREYYLDATTLLASDYTPGSVLASGLGPVQALTGSTHPFYWYWNVLWVRLIGDTIFAPIVSNVFVAVVGSIVATTLVAKLGYAYRYQQYFLVFTLLHWEVLAWTSVANLKDPLTATLTIGYFYLFFVFLSADRKGKALAATGIAGIFLLFTTIRFYIPTVMIVATVGWKVLEDLRSRPGWISIYSVVFGVVLAAGLFVLGSVAPDTGMIVPTKLVAGLVKFPLTPTPWDIASHYQFLSIPATLHWLAFPLTLIGGVWLGLRRRERLLVTYVLAIVLVYAVLPDLLGPRHRLQVIYIVAFMQFHGAWTLLHRHYRFFLRTSEDAPEAGTARRRPPQLR